MPSAASLANLRPYDRERARAARAKAEPALRILNANRAIQRALNHTKNARLPVNGRQVAQVVAAISARDEERQSDIRSLRSQVAALSRMPTRADYRRAVLERNLGRATVEPVSRASKSTSHESHSTPIEQSDEPSMLEPIGFAPRRRAP